MNKTAAVLVVIALVVVTVGCERLAALQNSNVRISGEWQKIEMSFAGDDVFDFADRVISINGIEEGTYRFESNSVLEVTLRGQLAVYEVDFIEHSKMIWYRKTSKGRERASEWVRTK